MSSATDAEPEQLEGGPGSVGPVGVGRRRRVAALGEDAAATPASVAEEAPDVRDELDAQPVPGEIG
jgi:hypothetical protein